MSSEGKLYKLCVAIYAILLYAESDVNISYVRTRVHIIHSVLYMTFLCSHDALSAYGASCMYGYIGGRAQGARRKGKQQSTQRYIIEVLLRNVCTGLRSGGDSANKGIKFSTSNFHVHGGHIRSIRCVCVCV